MDKGVRLMISEYGWGWIGIIIMIAIGVFL